MALIMNLQPNLLRINFVIKFLISGIFFISSIGKLWEPQAAALNFINLFSLSPGTGKTIIFLLCGFEIILAALIWWRITRLLLIIPVVLWFVVLWSYLKGAKCGCFGSLPVLSDLSFGSHFLLIMGIFLGTLFMMRINEKQASEAQHLKGLKLCGIFAIMCILLAFVPYSSFVQSKDKLSIIINRVNRQYVEGVILFNSAVIIDARSNYEFQLGHIPGSINIPYETRGLDSLLKKHELDGRQIVVYCSTSRCNASLLLAESLQRLGCENVQVYSGGWEDWTRKLRE